ncbi:MAG: DUF362 domain-containing protein [Candidatus Aminicenantaceae bacterium]
MKKSMDRREFLKKGACWGAAAAAGGTWLHRTGLTAPFPAFAGETPDIGVAEGSDYFEGARRAVEFIGGMGRFVSPGKRVALLPNVQRWHPGTYTKPEIVRAVVQMCRKAGSESVTCLSWLGARNWEATGLKKVLEEEGAELKLIEREEAFFKPVPVPGGVSLKEAMIMKEFYNHDVFINMPVTKDHAGNKFTGTLKNLMGLNSPQNNRLFHKPDWQTDAAAVRYLDQCIVDLNTIIKPHLCVVDAAEFIITNGPMGPGEVIKPQKVIAGVDRVAVDAYCTTLWDIKAEDIIMIKNAYERGLGRMDLSQVSIKEG